MSNNYAFGFKEYGWSPEDRHGTRRMIYECSMGHFSLSRLGQGTKEEPYHCPKCNGVVRCPICGEITMNEATGEHWEKKHAK